MNFPVPSQVFLLAKSCLNKIKATQYWYQSYHFNVRISNFEWDKHFALVFMVYFKYLFVEGKYSLFVFAHIITDGISNQKLFYKGKHWKSQNLMEKTYGVAFYLKTGVMLFPKNLYSCHFKQNLMCNIKFWLLHGFLSITLAESSET